MMNLQVYTIPLHLKSKNMHWLEGVTSNTDAAQLAEKFAEAKCPTKVCVIPVDSCLVMNVLFYFLYLPALVQTLALLSSVLSYCVSNILIELSISLGGWCSCYIKWGSQESVC